MTVGTEEEGCRGRGGDTVVYEDWTVTRGWPSRSRWVGRMRYNLGEGHSRIGEGRSGRMAVPFDEGRG